VFIFGSNRNFASEPDGHSGGLSFRAVENGWNFDFPSGFQVVSAGDGRAMDEKQEPLQGRYGAEVIACVGLIPPDV